MEKDTHEGAPLLEIDKNAGRKFTIIYRQAQEEINEHPNAFFRKSIARGG
jgi:hypothetical protein